MADHAGKVQAGDNVPSMYVRGFFFFSVSVPDYFALS